MRVVVISNGFNDYTIQMANALAKRGVVVLLIMPESDNSSLDETVDLGAQMDTYLYPQPRLYQASNISLMYRFLKEIDRFRPDVIHLQGAHLWLSFIMPILKMKGYALAITFHDPIPHEGENYMRTRFSNYCGRLFCDRAFTHGERLRELMIERLQYPENRVHAITMGECNVAPFKRFESQDIAEDGHNILFFGRIHAYKGLEYLIKAAPLIAREVPDAKVIIAGAGEDFEKYERMIVDRQNFSIYNYLIPFDKGAELIQKSSVIVLPYTDASQSGVVPTAYGFKKPVIVTDVGAIPEIVDDGITGFIVPPRDPEALARATITLLRDDSLRIWMGEQGYRKLKTDMSWDAITERIEGIYQEMI